MRNRLSICLLTLLFSLPGWLAAQSCSGGKILTPQSNLGLANPVPAKAHTLSFRNPYHNRNIRGISSSSRSYKIYVMERFGDCYKIANSDLGRTMKIRSKDFALLTGEHYDLSLRKIEKPDGGEAEAPRKIDCEPEWEVVSGQSR